MHAIQVSETGGPDQLVLADVPEPQPAPGEVIVNVEAAGVNFIDVYHRTGLYPRDVPFVPGLEAAGTIGAVGPGVEGFAEGDRVAYSGVPGAYAERAAVPAAQLVTLPETVETRTGAAVMLQGMTAHYLAEDTYPLGSDDTCLVHAGAGGVGRLLIQIAKRRGATVVTTVSTEEKERIAEAAGADHVIRYVDTDFAEASRDLLGAERPYDVIYDSVGKTTFHAGLGLLKPRGLMALFGQSSGKVDPIDLGILNQHGSLYVTRPTLFHYVSTRADLERRATDIFRWIASGELDVLVGDTYALAAAADAHRALEGRKSTGKVLLLP